MEGYQEFTSVPSFLLTCARTGFLFPGDMEMYVPDVRNRGMMRYRLNYGPALFEFVA